jgi:Phosphoesterase family
MPESVEIPAPVSTATAATPRAHGGAWPGGATASAGPSAATALSSPCRDRQHLPRYPGSPEPDNAAQLGELRYAEAPVSEHEVTSWLARWWRRLLPRSQARLIDEAAATAAPGAARLGDIEHVVILMQENRSFDQYFGTMSAVRGFSDPRAAVRDVGGTRYPVFDQFGYRPGGGPDPSGYLQPFRLVSDPPVKDGQTTNDIAHDWPTQHRSWHDGQLDQFVTAHLATDGAENGPLTMGYYTRQDLAFYYALANAFTVCDGYFSSVMGPTDPNRVMAISGTIDPDGKAGGPEPGRPPLLGRLRSHVAAAVHRDQVRRRGTQPFGLAAQRHRGHDQHARPGPAAGADRAAAASGRSWRRVRGRAGRARRPGGHARRRDPVPGPGRQRHAVAGERPAAPAGPGLTDARSRIGNESAPTLTRALAVCAQ